MSTEKVVKLSKQVAKIDSELKQIRKVASKYEEGGKIYLSFLSEEAETQIKLFTKIIGEDYMWEVLDVISNKLQVKRDLLIKEIEQHYGTLQD